MDSPRRARIKLLKLWFAIAMQASALMLLAASSIQGIRNESPIGFNTLALASLIGLACLPTLILSPLIASLAATSRAWRTLMGASLASLAILLVPAFIPDPSPLSITGLFSLASAFVFVAASRLFIAVLAETRSTSTLTMVLATFGLVFLVGTTLYLGTNLVPELNEKGYSTSTIACVPVILSFLVLLQSPNQPNEYVPLSEGIVRPFLRGTCDAFRLRLARNSLIGLWVWTFVLGAFLLVICTELADRSGTRSLMFAFGTGILGGIAISACNPHSYRCGWTIAYASTWIFAQVLFFGFNNDSVKWPLISIGIALGAILPSLLHYYFTWTTARHHGTSVALLHAGWCAGGILLAWLVFSFEASVTLMQASVLDVLICVTGLATVGAWLGFFRPAVEGTVEILLWPIYRIRGRGPGMKNMPLRGPCLVIANHSAWLDPLYIAKVMSPPIVPMMTSKFYDLPVISFLMRRVIGTIRVPETPYRHEAPELLEAVAALDRGECVVIFPEAYLRRKEEQPLRRFGRGVWKILADRPQTPIFLCWIEGNWGSFFSYKGGPPTKGKRMDFWQRLDVGISGPITIDPALLSDHMAVRSHLMHQVAAARTHLGLEPVTISTIPAEGDKE